MDRLLTAAVVLIGVPAILVAYIWLTERVLRVLPTRRRAGLRPWLWLAPALGFLGVFLVYPTIRTIVISLYDKQGDDFVGLANYGRLVGDREMPTILFNNLLWLIFFTLLVVTLGLVIAVLTDRVRYESAAKALIFLPMAISFVAAGVIWKFMYDYDPDLGTLNATLGLVGVSPQTWLIDSPRNTFMLIVVAVWMQTGFAMVILSAGLKGISTELLEAARIDGAGEFQIFRRIILPLLAPTLAVVATTMVITALKAFDVVYVMTGGNFNTNILSLRMYDEMFSARHFGRGAAVAVILLAAIVPIMLYNIRRFREQEAIR
ncbi:MAG: sugar ABC transporter permease [Chloroflexota bacterium]|nr:sugar ABC transporter permease [Chloroflexota bacterium]